MTITSLTLKNSLLQGSYNAASLQTALGTASTLAALRELLNNRAACDQLFANATSANAILGAALAQTEVSNSETALRALAGSTLGTERLCRDGAALLGTILNDTNRSRWWLEHAAAYARLKSQVNASGSKLKRQVFTSSGTWTKPATLHAISVALIGGGAGGGGGDTSATTESGGGGGGGEAKTGILTAGSMGATETVTCGAAAAGGTGGAGSNPGTAGNTSSFGAHLSAAGGAAGGAGSTGLGGAGGGSTTNGGRAAMTDVDIQNAAWQAITAGQKGGDGGDSAVAGTGRDGGPGLTLDGYGQGAHSSTNTRALAGTYGGGGGAGDNTGTSGTPTAGTYGGGGAGGNTTGGSTGGTSGAGLCVVYWVEG